MRVRGTGDLQKGTTPAFEIEGPEASSLARAFGAVFAEGAWMLPAYYPFGLQAAQDLETLGFKEWDISALRLLRELLRTEAQNKDLEKRWEQREACLPEVPEDFFSPTFFPYAHQSYGIAQAILWPRRWFLWEMGTGKTRTILDALRFLDRKEQFQRALILGPPVVLPGWLRELKRVSRGAWKGVIWDGSPERAEEAAAPETRVVLATYTRTRLEACFSEDVGLGAVRIFAPERSPLRALQYDVLVCDESHNLGNWKSDQTQAVYELSKGTPRRYLLTGTAGDTPGKLYSQLRILAPAILPISWEKFQERYCVYRDKEKHVVVGYAHLNELAGFVDSIASRMYKRECMDLPPETQVDVPFDLGMKQRARYNELVLAMQASVAPELAYLEMTKQDNYLPLPDESEPAPEPPALLLPHEAVRVNKLLQVISGGLILGPDETICDACEHLEECVEQRIRPYTKHCVVVSSKPKRVILRDVENPKLQVFEELLTSILEEDPTNKVLVWGIFDFELDDLTEYLTKKKIGHVRLDGRTTKHVEQIEHQFQTDPECRVLVGMTSAGIGINLPAANYAIFYSLIWSSLKYEQALERMNRPGQKRKMTVYRLVTSEASAALDRLVARSLEFKDDLAYTMSGKIACAACPRMSSCALDGTRPFQQNCTYAASVVRPLATADVVGGSEERARE